MKRKGVRVRRVVRRVELWPVAKIGLLFHVVCFGLSLGVGVVVWQAARRAGVLDDLAKFLGDVGVVDDAKKDIQFHGDAVFRGALYAGGVLVVINTLATVLLAFFYNLLAGIFGGLVVSFLEEPTRMATAQVPVVPAATIASGGRRNRSGARPRPAGSRRRRSGRGKDGVLPAPGDPGVNGGEGRADDAIAWAPERPESATRRSRRDPVPSSWPTVEASSASTSSAAAGMTDDAGTTDADETAWQATGFAADIVLPSPDLDDGPEATTGDSPQVSTAPSWATRTPWDV